MERKPLVYLVEDEPDIREIESVAMKRNGFAYEAFGTGDDCHGVERDGELIDIHRHLVGEGLFYRPPGYTVFTGGIDDEHAVSRTFNHCHMGVVPCRSLYSQPHAGGVTDKQQVAAVQVFPLGVGGVPQHQNNK